MSKLHDWLLSSKYLPEFMRDFHDQKSLFKFIHATYAETSEEVPDNIPNWVSSHIYTIDWFLWFMASCGYTLQKTRTKLDFNELPQYRQSVESIENPKPKYIKASTAKNREMLLENKITLLEEDIECAHMVFDDLGIPRFDGTGKNKFSLTGRHNLSVSKIAIDVIAETISILKDVNVIDKSKAINSLIQKHKGE